MCAHDPLESKGHQAIAKIKPVPMWLEFACFGDVVVLHWDGLLFHGWTERNTNAQMEKSRLYLIPESMLFWKISPAKQGSTSDRS